MKSIITGPLFLAFAFVSMWNPSLSCLLVPSITIHAADGVSPAEARAVVKGAYIYGFPMVEGYRIQYAYFVDRNNPEFNRRRRGCGNVGIPRLLRDFQVRWRVISTVNR